MSLVTFLQTNNGAPQGPNFLLTLLPFLLIIVIFYFFLIRPQNKKQKETDRMLNALKKGDKVVTIGGIHGVIASVKEQSVLVKVDESCKIEFTRSAIATVELSEAEKAKLAAEAAEKKASKKKNKKAEKAAKVEEAKAEKTAKAEETKTEDSEEK